MAKIGFYFDFAAPPGVTPIRKLPHKLQLATVEKLRASALPYKDNTVNTIRGHWKSWYPEGWGTIARTLKGEVDGDRTGISISFSAAGRHLPLITQLGGGIFEPGATFIITPTGESENEFLAFFWKRKGRWARFLQVEHPGWNVDYLAQAFEAMGRFFQRDMLSAYQRGVADFSRSAGKAKPIGKKTRKSGG